MADTREQVAALNGAIRDRLVAAGDVDDRLGFVTDAGERLGLGDRVMTRRNDHDLAVANRDTWTLTGIDHDGTLTLFNRDARAGTQSRSLPATYAHEHVELAYATTVHGAQGETTHTGHLLLGEHTSAAAAYVAMTRGRENNMAHLVAENLDEARQLWVETFSRDRADLGPAHAAQRAAEDLERYAPHRPLQAATGRPPRRLDQTTRPPQCPGLAPRGSTPSWPATATLPTSPEFQAAIEEIREQLTTATGQVHALLHEPALRSLPPERVKHEHDHWLQDREHKRQLAAEAHWEERNNPRPSRSRPLRVPEHT